MFYKYSNTLDDPEGETFQVMKYSFFIGRFAKPLIGLLIDLIALVLIGLVLIILQLLWS